ncbi:hypothetical protein [uncultured Microbacterium sp.]|uniref:hypothetical protein n=1 Tax=uncultured Microbacterium sp. TaxID=191216 RepID=UPI0025D6FC1C|nr:hypothetical protein [uncultured Microbacterium sp.]
MPDLSERQPAAAKPVNTKSECKGGREGAAAAAPSDQAREPEAFEKGGLGWTVGAAVLSVVVMIVVTCCLAASGVISSDTFINVLAVVSVSIAGVGSIFRAIAHGAANVFERRIDHAGKLLTIVALSSGLTGALARIDIENGTYWGVGVALLAGFFVVLGICAVKGWSKRAATGRKPEEDTLGAPEESDGSEAAASEETDSRSTS